MLDRVAVAGVSVLNITETDWRLLQKLADNNGSLNDTESEAFLDFSYFDPDCSVNVHLGRVLSDKEEDATFDLDIYKLALANKFSTAFADFVIQARREGFDYLVFEPNKDACKDKEVYW